MRLLKMGLSGLCLAACTLQIGPSATDGASATEAATVSSSGGAPTTGGTQGTGSTGPVTTSESASSTGDASVGETGAPGTTGSAGSTGDTGGQEIVDATIDDACAPNDGPALEFRLGLVEAVCEAGWPGDVLRVVLFQGGPLAPGSYPLDGGLGFAWLQQGNLPELTSETGTIVIDAWDGETVSGSYMLTGLGAGVIEGSFAGPHCAGALCG